jgi:hypothetical protein
MANVELSMTKLLERHLVKLFSIAMEWPQIIVGLTCDCGGSLWEPLLAN